MTHLAMDLTCQSYIGEFLRGSAQRSAGFLMEESDAHYALDILQSMMNWISP